MLQYNLVYILVLSKGQNKGLIKETIILLSCMQARQSQKHKIKSFQFKQYNVPVLKLDLSYFFHQLRFFSQNLIEI